MRTSREQAQITNAHSFLFSPDEQTGPNITSTFWRCRRSKMANVPFRASQIEELIEMLQNTATKSNKLQMFARRLVFHRNTAAPNY